MWSKAADGLTDALKILGAVCLTAMIALTVVDVAGRFIGRPVEGAIESTGFLATLVLAFAMPYSHRERVHIGVDILTRRLPPRVAAALEAVTGTAACVLFGFIARQSYLYAVTIKESGERSMTLQLPVHLFIYAVAFSFAALALIQFLDVLRSARRTVGR
ncbi:MAG: TRAP transporter small permease [Deltaproteobacteria bacterium]|nr:TRAP transporter small permease [Deltaproteobacteria bacterium]